MTTKFKHSLKTSLIAIKRIDPELTEDDLHQTDLHYARGAELILEARGIINPLVVRRTNNVYDGIAIDEDTPDGRYVLVNGHFEYFCAVRARKIDPTLENIQAWIITEKNRYALENQLALFREDDNFIDDHFEMDFELVEDDIETMVAAALHGKTLDECFEAAQGLVNIYPEGEDREKAIEELERIKDMASGDRTYQDRLDNFFAETGGVYE